MVKTKLGFVGLLAVCAAACGEESAPPPQSVMFFSLSGGASGQCIVSQQFELPLESNAREGAVRGFSPEESPRLVDGEGRVECTVAPLDTGDFEVVFRLSSGVVGNFQGRGTLGTDGGTLNVTFAHSSGVVAQSDCTATVGALLDGAVHISNLLCPDMTDSRSSNIHCNGTGAIILENCIN